MSFSADELKKLAAPLVILLALLAAGGGLIYWVQREQAVAAQATKPVNVEVFASTMKVGLALLHEGDLIDFLRDLRESGNAYYSVKRCAIVRTGTPPTGTNIAPRLRADCEIDLITIVDRAAKS
jgi:hypothetical protein